MRKTKLSEVHDALDEQLSKYIGIMKYHLVPEKCDNIACFVKTKIKFKIPKCRTLLNVCKFVNQNIYHIFKSNYTVHS